MCTQLQKKNVYFLPSININVSVKVWSKKFSCRQCNYKAINMFIINDDSKIKKVHRKFFLNDTIQVGKML